MKTINSLIRNFILTFLLITITNQGQAIKPISTSVKQSVNVSGTTETRSSASTGCEYILDDGIGETNIGLGAAGDFMWLNSFSAIAGCENINMVSLAWGTVPNGTPARIILYDDLNNDGNPSDAVYLAEISVSISNSNTGIFNDYSFPPTTVNDGYFVAVVTIDQPSTVFPAVFDQTSSNLSSYYVESYVGGAIDIMNLMNNDTPPNLVDNVSFPGNWLLRTQGQPNDIPLSNSGIFLSLILFVGVLTFRKRLF